MRGEASSNPSHTLSCDPHDFVPSFVIGRWWIIPLAAVVRTTFLLAGGTIDVSGIPGAAAFAGLNAAVGVGALQVLLALSLGSVRRSRRWPTRTITST
jgi:hypothetical protein